MTSPATVEIDGSLGEGGGQILRSALALSLVTGKAFRLRNIRAGRPKPGLQRQHLTAVEAAAEVGAARVDGAALGSRTLSFVPGSVRAGRYRFSVGTAGSTTLVLQTVLPPLLVARGPSEVVLEGGTHNPYAPPFDFLERVFLPLVARMGPRVRAELERPGFYPGGGGRFHVVVEPVSRLAPIELLERGTITATRALARVSNLPLHIAERELATVEKLLAWPADCLCSQELRGAVGPGNVLTLEIEAEHVTELFTGFGRRGLPAEQVAERVVREVRDYVQSGAPVGPHLADQLLVPLAMAGAGSYRTAHPTPHTRTNAEVVQRFLDVAIEFREDDPGRWTVAIAPRDVMTA